MFCVCVLKKSTTNASSLLRKWKEATRGGGGGGGGDARVGVSSACATAYSNKHITSLLHI